MSLADQAERRMQALEAKWAAESRKTESDDTSIIGDLFFFSLLASLFNLAIRGILSLTD